MGTQMKAIILLAAPVAATGFSHPQDTANFSRTYKVGAKSTYVATFSTELLGHHTLSVDMALSVTKLTAEGKPQVLVHMSNKQTTGEGNDTTVLPGDLSYTLGANCMPVHFAATQGDASFFELVLFMAASTVDKQVKVGDDIPWSWSDGPVALKGSTKVLEISTDKKRLKALITQKMTMGGQEAGTFSLTSNYDLTDGSLIDSEGTLAISDIKQGLKFVRK